MISTIRTIIVDDEKQAREGVQLLLQAAPLIEVIALCKNGLEAIEQIERLQPDLLLLDIQMPGINGFEVLNSLQKSSLPAVIFITAFDEYALKAFEVHAIDYLLKPFTDQRFFEAIHHAKKTLQQVPRISKQQHLISLLTDYLKQNTTSDNAHLLKDYQMNQITHNNRIAIKSAGKIHFIALADIRFLEGYDTYIKVHSKGQVFLVKESLKAMEKKLQAQNFVRIQKSYIINMNYVTTLEPYFNGDFFVQLSTGEKLKGSRNFRKQLLTFMGT